MPVHADDRVEDGNAAMDSVAGCIAPDASERGMQQRSAHDSWDTVRNKVSQQVKVSRCFATLRDMTDERCIDPKQLAVIKTIGNGAFATIDKATFLSSDGRKTLVAVKRLKGNVLTDESEAQQLIGEICLLRKLRHGSIVEYLGVGQEDDPHRQLLLVEEFMEGGTLKQMVTKQMLLNGRVLYTYCDALRWFLQIAKGLKYLHSVNPMVIHRDLKLENILLTGGTPDCMNAKICDFGLSVIVDHVRGPLKDHFETVSTTLTTKQSKFLEDEWNLRTSKQSVTRIFRLNSITGRAGGGRSYDMSGQTGSLMYMAPEVFKFQPYNEKADVFAFGVMMYETFYRYMMLSAISIQGTVEELERYAARVSEGYRPPLKEGLLPPEVDHIISRCWAQSPAERPDMGWVVERLKEVDESGALRKFSQDRRKAEQSCFGCFG